MLPHVIYHLDYSELIMFFQFVLLRLHHCHVALVANSPFC